ncbi:MAG: hypothetical protein Q9162_007184 [Coniocarpon cinnabarinum]
MAALVAAVPAPQAASTPAGYGYGPTPTAAPSQYSSATSMLSSMMASVSGSAGSGGSLASTFGPDSQVSASQVVNTAPIVPIRSSQVTGATSHGPYSGTPTTTGAPQSGPAASSVAAMPPNPTATYYNANGELTEEEPAPYTPAGGLGTNGSLPRYMVNSDFDFESIALGLYQEWIELDLFHNGLAVFSEQDFLDAGLTAEDRSYIEFMADQESGHATLLTNMLGEAAPPQCTYDYPFTTVREYVDFNQRLTRWGESGVWGFINHLDSREVGQLLAQSIATEARQQYTFRQMSGLHPMSVWFETGIPQSWSWTYLAPYISSCPAGTTRLAWQNFPTLHIVNNANINRFSPNDTKDYEVTGRRIADPSNSTIPSDESCEHLNVTGVGCGPAIAHNKSEPLSFAGKQIFFEWENPGQPVGPNNSYITASSAGTPAYVAWVNQLNLTYSDLTVTGPNSGFTYQPEGFVYAGDPIINQTMFVALTDTDAPFTPFNLSMINPHVAALGLYVAG